MEKTLTSIKQLTGARVYSGKKNPRGIGKIRDVVFYPNKNCVAGFLTKRSDFLWMFKRKGHFVAINSYSMHEGAAFVDDSKGSLDESGYKALGLNPGDCIVWMGLPVIAENGQSLGTISDVAFTHQSGDVQCIKVGMGTVGGVLQGSRTIPIEVIKGFSQEISKDLAHAAHNKAAQSNAEAQEYPPYAIVVLNEALELAVENGAVAKAGKKVSEIANTAGVDTGALSHKAHTAAKVAGALATSGAVATGKHIKKTRGMFSDFKEEYNKARKP